MARKKKSKTEVIDFRGVDKEIRQRGRRVPEGEYTVKLTKAEKGWKDNDKSNAPYYRWTMQILEPKKYRGVPLYGFITSMKQDALFNLRNLIYAASDGKKNVAGKKVKFTASNFIGKKILAIVQDDEYKPESGPTRINSRVVDVRPLSDKGKYDEEEEADELDEDEEEEEEEDEEEEDAEEEEDEDEEGDDEDEEEEDEDEEELDEVDVDEI